MLNEFNFCFLSKLISPKIINIDNFGIAHLYIFKDDSWKKLQIYGKIQILTFFNEEFKYISVINSGSYQNPQDILISAEDIVEYSIKEAKLILKFKDKSLLCISLEKIDYPLNMISILLNDSKKEKFQDPFFEKIMYKIK